MAVHEVRVDRSKTLVEEPATGHNRWHPDIAPIVRCEPGDEVVLETRDAFDGQMGPQATLDTVAAPNLGGPAQRTDPRLAVHGHDRVVAGTGSAAPDHRAREGRAGAWRVRPAAVARVRRAVRSGDRR